VNWSGFLKAGEATLRTEEGKLPSGREACLYTLSAATSPWFRSIYDARFRFHTYTDCAAGRLLRVEKEAVERGTARTETCVFHPEETYAETGTGYRFPVVPDGLDPLAALFAVRAARLEAGGQYSLDVQDMGRNVTVDITVAEPEAITVPAGEFQALRLECVIKRRMKLRPDIPAQIWLSSDDSRIPLKVTVRLPLGSAVVLLTAK
jgi:hypothetical protein